MPQTLDYKQIHRKQVLIIDDSIESGLLLKVLLMRQQCSVKVVPYPFYAYDAIREAVPEVVILNPNLCWFPKSFARRLQKAFPAMEVYYL